MGGTYLEGKKNKIKKALFIDYYKTDFLDKYLSYFTERYNDFWLMQLQKFFKRKKLFIE